MLHTNRKTVFESGSSARWLYILLAIPAHLLLLVTQLHYVFQRASPNCRYRAESAPLQSSSFLKPNDVHSHIASNSGSGEIFEARGQHVLLDLYHVEAAFLNDKDGLLQSMIKFVEMMDMNVMGYIAEQLQPQGVSITIALKESHFTIHTYPEVGTAFVDLFTCGDTQLLKYKSQLAATFGANFLDTEDTKWALIPRGVKQAQQLNDLSQELSFLQSEKRLVFSGSSPIQNIDIWEVRGDDYTGQTQTNMWSKILFMDGSLQSCTRDEYKYHESLVHPAMLSHHRSPRRVAILGGGEGATLREVLKYKSVEYVEMIEIDRGIVEAAKSFLPELHNCSFLHSHTTADSDSLTNKTKPMELFSCFDDKRVRVVYEDAVAHFGRRAKGRKGFACQRNTKQPEAASVVGKHRLLRGMRKKQPPMRNRLNAQRKNQKYQKLHKTSAMYDGDDNDYDNDGDGDDGFDVIIMDLFDPEDKRQDIVNKLYSRKTLASIACSLRKDGVMVMQMGGAAAAADEKFRIDDKKFNQKKLDILQDMSSLLYDEQSAPSQLFVYNAFIDSFGGEWSFAMLFSSSKGPTNFHHNAARVELTLRRRIISAALPLKYVDGTVIETLSKLPREWEDAYCAQDDQPEICRLFSLPSQEERTTRLGQIEPMVVLQPSSMHTDIGEANRWEAVAAVDIPQWTDLGLYDAATSIRISLEEYELLENFVEETKSKEYADYLNMINRFAYECNDANGQYIYYSLDSKNTFVNHGCNASVINTGSVDFAKKALENSDSSSEDDDSNDEDDDDDDDDDDDPDEVDDFNLVIQRHDRHYCVMSLALRSIKKGEQLLEDYGQFGDSWKPPSSWCPGA